MANPESTSFIPQRPTKGKVGARRVRKLYVLTYISYILFFGAILSAGVVFFFNYTMQAQLEDQKQQLAAERDRFNRAEIESVRELEKRMSIAQTRMANHISLLTVFRALEESTVQAMRFTDFSYKRHNDQAPVVTLTATTGRFDGALFQREVLSQNPILSEGKITEISLAAVDANQSDEIENIQQVITFVLESEIDPSLVQYSPQPQSESDQTSDQEEATATETGTTSAQTIEEPQTDDQAAPQTMEQEAESVATSTNEVQ